MTRTSEVKQEILIQVEMIQRRIVKAKKVRGTAADYIKAHGGTITNSHRIIENLYKSNLTDGFKLSNNGYNYKQGNRFPAIFSGIYHVFTSKPEAALRVFAEFDVSIEGLDSIDTMSHALSVLPELEEYGDQINFRRLPPALSEGDFRLLSAMAGFVASVVTIYNRRVELRQFYERLDRLSRTERPNAQTLRLKIAAQAAEVMGGFGYAGESPLVINRRRAWGNPQPEPIIANVEGEVPVNMIHSRPNTYSESIPVVYSSRVLNNLAKFGRDLIVDAGSRKALITYAEPYELEEAKEEGVSMYEVTLTYAMNKRDMFKYKSKPVPNMYNRDADTNPEAERTFQRVYLSEFPVYINKPLEARCPPSEVENKSAQIAPGLSLDSSNRTGHNRSLIKRVVSRTDECEGFDIDTSKEAVVCLDNAAVTKETNWVPAVKKKETRWVATWDSDTGHTVVKTGTTPKRALANIRRRIRDEIVDTLDIFS